MTYDEAVRYIRETAAFGTRLGLDNITALMSLLGNPQDRLKIIHIAGTNGKGSVAACLLSILETSGYRTGFYTSPELVRFSERIRIGQEEIRENDTAFYATKVREAAEYMSEHAMGSPSEFELVLAMAFCYFSDRAVDAVILETGLGGRLDATNVISSSLLSVITKISFDHMQYLGDTLPLIAGEKAAIIKPGGRVLVYPAEKDIMDVFEGECRNKNAELITAELPEASEASLSEGQTFILKGVTYRTVMRGLYETDNASLAIQAAGLLRKDLPFISESSISLGIEKAVWPGRFEILEKDPFIIADGAHNADGAKALAESLERYFGNKRLTFCMGILRDKQYREMLSLLLPFAAKVIACKVDNPRSLSAGELTEAIEAVSPGIDIIPAAGTEEACVAIKKLRHETAATVICGSLYLVGPMREEILKP